MPKITYTMKGADISLRTEKKEGRSATGYTFPANNVERENWLSISSVNEVLEFIQKLRREPKEFMTSLVNCGKINYRTLWMLTQLMFFELCLYLDDSLYLSCFCSLIVHKDTTKNEISEGGLHDLLSYKKKLEKTAVLDLKKIKGVSAKEIPEKLVLRIKILHNYLNKLIVMYTYYENGFLITDPSQSVFFPGSIAYRD